MSRQANQENKWLVDTQVLPDEVVKNYHRFFKLTGSVAVNLISLPGERARVHIIFPALDPLGACI